MKSNHSRSSYSSIFARLALSAALVSSMSLSHAGEVVTTSKNKVAPLAKVDGDTPTAVEMKMGAVKSTYKACEGVVTVERPADTKKWKEQEAFWSKYPAEGCDKEKVNCDRMVQFIPDTHFYKTFDGRPNAPNFTSTESANDFLARVGKASIENTKARIASYKAQKKCFEEMNGACAKASNARLAALKAQIPEFRMIVARLLEKSPTLLTVEGYVPTRGDQLVNRKMKDAEQFLMVPKGQPELSQKEQSALQAELDAILAQSLKSRDADIESYIKEQKVAADQQDRFRSNLRDPKMYGPKLKDELNKKRVANTDAYVKMLKNFPELAYVNDSDLTPNGMKEKLGEMISDSNETMEEMVAANDTTTKGLGPGGVSSKRMIFAAHTETIENMLKKEGTKSCAVANAVYNEMASIRTKDGVIIGGITVAASLGSGLAGFFKGKAANAATAVGLTSEAGTLTAQALWMGRLAIASGAGGGATNTIHELNEANKTTRDANVGVVRIEDGKEALAGKTVTTALGILDFQGTGTLFAAGAGFAGYGLTKLGLANILKGGGKGGAKAAEDLAAKIVAAEAGDKAAASSVLKAGAAEEKRILGNVTPADRDQLSKVVSSGAAGTSENPNPETLKVAADNLRGLQGESKAAYVKSVEDVTAKVRANTPKGSDPARELAAQHAIVEGAGIVPDSELAKIVANPEFDKVALTGWAAVAAKVRKLKGTAEERFMAAWESLRAKAGLAKEKISALRERCRCGGFCPVGAVAVYNGGELFEMTTEPVYMACAPDLPITL